MTELHNIEYVQALQSHLRSKFNDEVGKEIMVFLEKLCGWYDFSESDKDQILIRHGGRRIVATLKTLLELKPEEIVAIANQKEIDNA